MEAKIDEFTKRAVQVAKYAALDNSNPETLEAMIAELVADGETLKKEVADVLRQLPA